MAEYMNIGEHIVNSTAFRIITKLGQWCALPKGFSVILPVKMLLPVASNSAAEVYGEVAGEPLILIIVLGSVFLWAGNSRQLQRNGFFGWLGKTQRYLANH